MSPSNQALKAALAAVERLSPELQKKLTERLITETVLRENSIIVLLQRLSPQKQARLDDLLDKNSEGRLTRAELMELRRLGSEVDQIMLANSHALALAFRPELFNRQGQPVERRILQALKNLAPGSAKPERGFALR